MSGTISEVLEEQRREVARLGFKAFCEESLPLYLRLSKMHRENQQLRDLILGMAERIYVQSNLLSRCAERAAAFSKKV